MRSFIKYAFGKINAVIFWQSVRCNLGWMSTCVLLLVALPKVTPPLSKKSSSTHLEVIFTVHVENVYIPRTYTQLSLMFRNVFWRDPVVRQRLEARLEQRWRARLCTRVEVASIIAVDDDMPVKKEPNVLCWNCAKLCPG